MGPRRRRGDALSVSLAAALTPALAPASTPPPPSPGPLSPRTPAPPPPQPEWASVAAGVSELFAAPPSPPGADVFGAPGRLRAMQAEVRTLLRGEAAALVPDFLRGRVLPSAMRALAAACAHPSGAGAGAGAEAEDAGVEVVLEAWARLWRHLLPALLAVFVHVRTSAPGVRALALLAFRDEVLLPREDAIVAALAAVDGTDSTDAPATHCRRDHTLRARLAHPLLVAAQAAALGPPPLVPEKDEANALRVEALLARCVSPLLGARGLYQHFRPAPAVPAPAAVDATGDGVAAVRMRRARGGRPLLERPLSVAAGQRLNTLAELFSAAAAAQRLRADS